MAARGIDAGGTGAGGRNNGRSRDGRLRDGRCTAVGKIAAADSGGPPPIDITVRDTGLAAGTAQTVRVRDDSGAVVISRRDGSARGRDASLPSSASRVRVRVLDEPRPSGRLWRPFSAGAAGGGGGFEDAEIEDGAEADVRLGAVAGQAAEGGQRHGGGEAPVVPNTETHVVFSSEIIGSR